MLVFFILEKRAHPLCFLNVCERKCYGLAYQSFLKLDIFCECSLTKFESVCTHLNIFFRYIEAIRRLKKAGKRLMRTVHMTFVPGKSFFFTF